VESKSLAMRSGIKFVGFLATNALSHFAFRPSLFVIRIKTFLMQALAGHASD
jgi:hypothetical protein